MWPGGCFLGLQPSLEEPLKGQHLLKRRSTRARAGGWGVDWVLSPAQPKKHAVSTARAYGFPPGMEARLEGRPVVRIGG